MSFRVAVLASGTGTNLQAIIDAAYLSADSGKTVTVAALGSGAPTPTRVS